MHPKFSVIITLLLIVNQSNNCFAQDMITDRPDQTESSVSLSPGFFQLESGTVLENTPQTQVWIANSTLFRYGVIKGLEMRMVTEIIQVESESVNNSGTLRMGDMQVGVKYQFLSQEKLTAAVIAHAIFPTGDEVLTSGQTGFSGVFCVSTVVGDKLSLGANAGYKQTDAENELAVFSTAAGYPLNSRLGFYAEVFGRGYGLEEMYWHYDNGFTYMIHENLQADLSFGTGLNARYGYYSLGISWRMKP
jgi:hypothetical protein